MPISSSINIIFFKCINIYKLNIIISNIHIISLKITFIIYKIKLKHLHSYIQPKR